MLVRTDIPIPGSRSAARVEENAAAAELVLDAADIAAIRALSEGAEVCGTRYAAPMMALLEGNCIPLDEWKGENENEVIEEGKEA